MISSLCYNRIFHGTVRLNRLMPYHAVVFYKSSWLVSLYIFKHLFRVILRGEINSSTIVPPPAWLGISFGPWCLSNFTQLCQWLPSHWKLQFFLRHRFYHLLYDVIFKLVSHGRLAVLHIPVFLLLNGSHVHDVLPWWGLTLGHFLLPRQQHETPPMWDLFLS